MEKRRLGSLVAGLRDRRKVTLSQRSGSCLPKLQLRDPIQGNYRYFKLGCGGSFR